MSDATAGPPIAQIVELLQNASCADQPSQVETIETHISWVFLADRFAYKLKKPVRFQFLDFSTPELRRRACEEEIRLNRRLAPDVYLAVAPITHDQRHGLQLDGDGQAVDWVVKMRRLPAERTLSRLICQRRLREPDVESIVEYLVSFYAPLPPQSVAPHDYHRHLTDHCRANLADLLDHAGASYQRQVRRIHGAQQRFLALRAQLFHDRAHDGRIVDGHGDLRAEHVYLQTPPVVIDCVEFSKELRQIDVVDELSFLAMDCQRIGNVDIGRRLLESYARASDDRPSDVLIAFYKSYRACVRAKVAALRSEQADDAEKRRALRQAHQYLSWAEHFAAELGPPAMVVVGGLMGSGKSTLAAALAKSIGAELFQTDAVRTKLFGRSESPSDYGKGIYQVEPRRQVYDELLSQAEIALDSGCSVVLDGTFRSNELRRAAVKRGGRHGAKAMFVQCECPRDLALTRIKKRAAAGRDQSEARPELLAEQLKDFEPLDPELSAVRVDSIASLSEELAAVHAELRTILYGEL